MVVGESKNADECEYFSHTIFLSQILFYFTDQRITSKRCLDPFDERKRTVCWDGWYHEVEVGRDG